MQKLVLKELKLLLKRLKDLQTLTKRFLTQRTQRTKRSLKVRARKQTQSERSTEQFEI